MINQHVYNKTAKILRSKRPPADTLATQRAGYVDQVLNELTLEFATFFKSEDEWFDANTFIRKAGFNGNHTTRP